MSSWLWIDVGEHDLMFIFRTRLGCHITCDQHDDTIFIVFIVIVQKLKGFYVIVPR